MEASYQLHTLVTLHPGKEPPEPNQQPGGPNGLDVLEESKISCPCCRVNYSSLVTQTKVLSVTSQSTELFHLHATFHLPKHTIFTQIQDEVFSP